MSGGIDKEPKKEENLNQCLFNLSSTSEVDKGRNNVCISSCAIRLDTIGNHDMPTTREIKNNYVKLHFSTTNYVIYNCKTYGAYGRCIGHQYIQQICLALFLHHKQ